MAKRVADIDLAPTSKKARGGKGTHTDADGTVADGVFAYGKLVQGTKTYKNGLVEVGVFADGKLVKGKKTYKNGTVEEGMFDNGDLMKGTKTSKTSTEKGRFEDGKIVEGSRDDLEEGMFADGVLRKGTACVYGVDEFATKVLECTEEDFVLYKGIWDKDEKYERSVNFTGVKFYVELKAQAYKDGIEVDTYVDAGDLQQDVDKILAGLQ